MRLNSLKPAAGSRKPGKRVGRGIGSGHGKTCGRGHKGQRSRSGYSRRYGFEGGQMPLKQRVPKLKGFNNPFRVEYQAVNLHTLQDLAAEVDGDITPDVLVEHGLVHKGAFVKILGRGELTAVGIVVTVDAPRVNRAHHDARLVERRTLEGGRPGVFVLALTREGAEISKVAGEAREPEVRIVTWDPIQAEKGG